MWPFQTAVESEAKTTVYSSRKRNLFLTSFHTATRTYRNIVFHNFAGNKLQVETDEVLWYDLIEIFFSYNNVNVGSLSRVVTLTMGTTPLKALSDSVSHP